MGWGRLDKKYECLMMPFFNLFCNTLRPHISKEDTRFRKYIPAEIKLAATLYYLSGASDYRTIANLFGLDRSWHPLLTIMTSIADIWLTHKAFISEILTVASITIFWFLLTSIPWETSILQRYSIFRWGTHLSMSFFPYVSVHSLHTISQKLYIMWW